MKAKTAPALHHTKTIWLKHVDGMNGIGPSGTYECEGKNVDGTPLKGRLMVDVLGILAKSIKLKKHNESLQSKGLDLTNPQLPHDPECMGAATPIDHVWDHGFSPLQTGFRSRPITADEVGGSGSENFQTFDQWVRILSTGRMVPVIVEYDPMAGRWKYHGYEPTVVRNRLWETK